MSLFCVLFSLFSLSVHLTSGPTLSTLEGSQGRVTSVGPVRRREVVTQHGRTHFITVGPYE